MKCKTCGHYTFDEHNVCVICAENTSLKLSKRQCDIIKCGDLHV